MSTLIDSAVPETADDVRFFGVGIAEVVANVDVTGLGRVQLRLPWLPGYQPWARVAVLSAGPNRGTFFIPQVGDEVLVAFNHGDVTDPFVIGSLWNGRDQTPRTGTLDPQTLRVIRTQAGHEIELDDARQSITILSASGQKLHMEPGAIEVSAGNGAASLKLTTAGTIEIKATSIKVQATAKLEGRGKVLTLKGQASATLEGGGLCTVKGGLVKIN